MQITNDDGELSIGGLLDAMRFVEDRTALSLPQYTRRSTINSRVFIDNTLAGEECMKPLMECLMNLYTGFIMVAMNMNQYIYGSKKIRDMASVVATEGFDAKLDPEHEALYISDMVSDWFKLPAPYVHMSSVTMKKKKDDKIEYKYIEYGDNPADDQSSGANATGSGDSNNELHSENPEVQKMLDAADKAHEAREHGKLEPKGSADSVDSDNGTSTKTNDPEEPTELSKFKDFAARAGGDPEDVSTWDVDKIDIDRMIKEDKATKYDKEWLENIKDAQDRYEKSVAAHDMDEYETRRELKELQYKYYPPKKRKEEMKKWDSDPVIQRLKRRCRQQRQAAEAARKAEEYRDRRKRQKEEEEERKEREEKVLFKGAAVKEMPREFTVPSGRIIEISLGVPAENGGKGGDFKIMLNLILAPTAIPPNVSEQFISMNFSPSLRQRWMQVRAGEVRFFQDFILAIDERRKRRKAMHDDKSGVLSSMIERQQNSLLNMWMKYLQITPERQNIANTILIFEKTNFDRSCSKAGLRFNDYNSRQRFFSKTFSMIVCVVDTMYSKVEIFYHGLAMSSQFTFTQLKNKAKLDSSDLAAIMKTYAQGMAPKY